MVACDPPTTKAIKKSSEIWSFPVWPKSSSWFHDGLWNESSPSFISFTIPWRFHWKAPPYAAPQIETITNFPNHLQSCHSLGGIEHGIKCKIIPFFLIGIHAQKPSRKASLASFFPSLELAEKLAKPPEGWSSLRFHQFFVNLSWSRFVTRAFNSECFRLLFSILNIGRYNLHKQ